MAKIILEILNFIQMFVVGGLATLLYKLYKVGRAVPLDKVALKKAETNAFIFNCIWLTASGTCLIFAEYSNRLFMPSSLMNFFGSFWCGIIFYLLCSALSLGVIYIRPLVVSDIRSGIVKLSIICLIVGLFIATTFLHCCYRNVWSDGVDVNQKLDKVTEQQVTTPSYLNAVDVVNIEGVEGMEM